MSIPHKHAEIIKAWADGYEIEAYNPEYSKWVTVSEPGWFNDIEYRIKPGIIEPRKPKFEEYVVRVDQDLFDEDNLELTNECSNPDHYNLKLLFKDGDLVQASVVDGAGSTNLDDVPW